MNEARAHDHTFAAVGKDGGMEKCIWCGVAHEAPGAAKPCRGAQTPPEIAKFVKRRRAVKEAVVWLCTNFPQAFPVAITKVRPLAIGVGDELRKLAEADENGPSRSALHQALGWWCNRPLYLRTIIAGKWRRDLEGNKVALPDDASIEGSRKRLASQREQRAAG